MGYKVRAVLATPFYDEDEDTVYSVDCNTKADLHKIETAFVKCLQQLNQLTEKEISSSTKTFTGTNPQLVTFEVNLSKDDGTDFGGYTFRWPNQTDDARAFLRGMLDGVMQQTGNQNKRLKRRKFRD